MAGDRVLVRLSIFSCLLAATSCFKTAIALKEHTKNLTEVTALIGVHWILKAQHIHRIKTALVKFTKHGLVVLQLPESSSITRLSSADVILQSGDVHPHPGPTLNHHFEISEGKPRVIYSASELIHYGENTCNPSIDHDLKLHLQNLANLNSCNYFSNARIFNIKTIIHSRRNSSIAISQRQISTGSNINNCVVIPPGRHTNKHRAIPVRITERDQAFKRRKAPSARVIKPVPMVAPALSNMCSNSSSGGGAYFPFVNGRYHLKWSLPFLRTVVAI